MEEPSLGKGTLLHFPTGDTAPNEVVRVLVSSLERYGFRIEPSDEGTITAQRPIGNPEWRQDPISTISKLIIQTRDDRVVVAWLAPVLWLQAAFMIILPPVIVSLLFVLFHFLSPGKVDATIYLYCLIFAIAAFAYIPYGRRTATRNLTTVLSDCHRDANAHHQ